MSKKFSNWFLKTKSKLFSRKESKCSKSGDSKKDITSNENQNDKERQQFQYSKKTKKKSNKSQIPVDLDLSNQRPNHMKFRSCPVSPKRIPKDDRGYLSDQNKDVTLKNNPYYNHSATVYAASVAQNDNIFKPRATLGSSEPFPFDVPSDPVPRQSLFYELRYGDRSSIKFNEDSKHIAEKPIENYDRPSFNSSTFNNGHLRLSTNYTAKLNSSTENTGRNTVVHVRPASTVNKSPRQSVKAIPLKVEEGLPSFSPNRFVRHVPLKSKKQKAPILMTGDGKVLQPVKTDKIRSNALRSELETPPVVKVSVVKPVVEHYHEDTIPVTPVRKSLRKSSIRRSRVDQKLHLGAPQRFSFQSNIDGSPESLAEKEDFVPAMHSRSSVRMSLDHPPMTTEEIDTKSDSGNNPNVEQENQPFPFLQGQNDHFVYAVQPSRGTRKSILQQSVKLLTSKNQKDEPTLYRKNIRYSMDTDVFAAETRRQSVNTSSPRFVNMEKGQPQLVSEFLSPITSLFITDLKDPVPKDPRNKPKEANVWVKPRGDTRQSVVYAQPTKPVTRVQQVYQSPPAPLPVQRRMSKKMYSREESSSSDESIVVYRKKSKQSAPRRSYYRTVYAAKIPSFSFPHHEMDKENIGLGDETKEDNYISKTSSSKDVCGLCPPKSSAPQFIKEHISENSPPKYKVKMVSSAQQTDFEDEMDLICYPSESILKNTAKASESGSKLRWRIIIKRGDEK